MAEKTHSIHNFLGARFIGLCHRARGHKDGNTCHHQAFTKTHEFNPSKKIS
jgi:hypothetical protein